MRRGGESPRLTPVDFLNCRLAGLLTFPEILLRKMVRIFPRIFWAFTLWVRKTPQKTSPTSFCRSAGRRSFFLIACPLGRWRLRSVKCCLPVWRFPLQPSSLAIDRFMELSSAALKACLEDKLWQWPDEDTAKLTVLARDPPPPQQFSETGRIRFRRAGKFCTESVQWVKFTIFAENYCCLPLSFRRRGKMRRKRGKMR